MTKLENILTKLNDIDNYINDSLCTKDEYTVNTCAGCPFNQKCISTLIYDAISDVEDFRADLRKLIEK